MVTLEQIFDRIGLAFDSEIGTYVHKDMKIPITVCYDEKEGVVLLDQTKLPYEITVWKSKDWRRVVDPGIKQMIVRGSQAIGCAAAYAFLLAVKTFLSFGKEEFMKKLEDAANFLKASRPTAYPLTWAVDLGLSIIHRVISEEGFNRDLIEESAKETADFVLASDLVMNWYLRQEGMKYIQSGDVIMTHCNGGSLSSSFGGHALGIIEEAYCKGKDLIVVAKETRPRCQGYKLTVWELNRAGVPTIIVTDNMILSSFKRFNVSKVMLGVDRITKDGFVFNKVGSADISLIAMTQKIPFYYATSYTTLDIDSSVTDVTIEERSIEEITYFYRLEREYLKNRGIISAHALDEWPPSSILSKSKIPKRGEVALYNPAFDITPPEGITQIITDIGSFKPVEIKSLTKEEITERVRKRLVEWGVKLPLE